MADSAIKIFFSWQSDLPSSNTRSVIQSSIFDAVKALHGVVVVEADRDTQGEFGSPDIMQTIFSKVDDCDIFIADVSIVNKYTSVDDNGNANEAMKLSPNPNVLLELGYAAAVVGWENVICILNTDYGAEKELPFDLSHRRLTPYSLTSTDKKAVRKYLLEIIVDTVNNLIKNGKRIRSSFSNLTVGSYIWATKEIVKALVPWNPTESPAYLAERKEAIQQCLELFSKIQSIQLSSVGDTLDASNLYKDENTASALPNTNRLSTLAPIDVLRPIVPVSQDVRINEDDRKRTSQLIKKYLGVDTEECFFDLGKLTRNFNFARGNSEELVGTDLEKAKYNDIILLEYQLAHIQTLEWYLKTFSGLYLFPLAIRNVSSIPDEIITVNIKIDTESADIIVPSAALFNSDINGLEGLIFENDNLKKLLMMQSNSDIQYATDISYDISDLQANIRHIDLLNPHRAPRYNANDYEREIRKYIASPIEGSTSEYSFDIQSLRPRETNWIGAAILVKPISETIRISYSVISRNSNGELSGSLECRVR
jgi:hypothetical protein